MMYTLHGIRPAALGLVVLSLSGCGWLFGAAPRAAAPDPSAALHQEAMAAFSDCASTADPAVRAGAAATLTAIAGQMQTMTRPSNPDHFFLLDRVIAAQGFCADAAQAVAR